MGNCQFASQLFSAYRTLADDLGHGLAEARRALLVVLGAADVVHLPAALVAAVASVEEELENWSFVDGGAAGEELVVGDDELRQGFAEL